MANASADGGNFGIVVSGGPAPGINSVIASVVSRAVSSGHDVYGIKGGFKGAVTAGQDAVVKLIVEQVSPVANTGGSILGTSRFNPFETKSFQEKLLTLIRENNIDKLIVIGGEGSAFLSRRLSELIPLLKVAHIPKTIDNDLILPNKHPSFGYETARYAGTRILGTLVNEAKTTNRWFIVRTMGRNAGFLALGLGIAAGATLTLIAEQFEQERLAPEDIASIIFSGVKKRLKDGKGYGTVVLAEGLIDKFDPSQVEEMHNCPRDDMGRIRFSEIDLEDLVAKYLRKKLRKAGLDTRVSSDNIGYELRCREPVPFDIEYTRLLGYGAVKYLLEGQRDIMVVRDFDNLAYVPLSHMVDEDGRIRTRKVDLNSDVYRAARSFMVQ